MKKIIAIILALVFVLSLVVVSQPSVICEVDSEIWAIKPRTTVDNVIVYHAVSGNKFSLEGIYTDAKGESWYIITGISKYNPQAGLDRGFIRKDNCSVSLGAY